MKTVLMFFCIYTAWHCNAQQKHVQVSQPEKLDTLIQRAIAKNKADGGMPGFRVQIFFGTQRKQALEAKTKFLQLYPETEVYLIYQQPYFKVRVGDFRSKLDAEPLLRNLLNEFNKVFIVPDKINFPRL